MIGNGALRAVRRAVEPEEIFQREVLHRHTAPAPTAWASEPEDAHPLAGESHGDADAERAWLIQMMAARAHQESR
ncbi:hypothetical protein ACFXJ8_23475 [Nonomuraea sp. NPDC059194]|uniref:hypothetical protein n=1 Tax=Nonomuraea sp. NPDC059194 TaxID=3346764 RepID=UPI0036B84287